MRSVNIIIAGEVRDEYGKSLMWLFLENSITNVMIYEE